MNANLNHDTVNTKHSNIKDLLHYQSENGDFKSENGDFKISPKHVPKEDSWRGSDRIWQQINQPSKFSMDKPQISQPSNFKSVGSSIRELNVGSTMQVVGDDY